MLNASPLLGRLAVFTKYVDLIVVSESWRVDPQRQILFIYLFFFCFCFWVKFASSILA